MFKDNPEAFRQSTMINTLNNTDSKITEDGFAWMTLAQTQKMMNDNEVGTEMCAEAKRRQGHFKVNEFVPTIDKAQLYLVPLTAKEVAKRTKTETTTQRFEAEADYEEAAELATHIHAASAFAKASGSRDGNSVSGGGPPAGKDEETLRKEAEEKRKRTEERERVKHLPVNRAERWINQCNARLSDLSAFDAKLMHARPSLGDSLTAAYRQELAGLMSDIKALRSAVETAKEGHADEEIVKLLSEADDLMNKTKVATLRVNGVLKEPKEPKRKAAKAKAQCATTQSRQCKANG